MASELFNRQDVGRGSGCRNQMFCSRDEYISGVSYRGTWQLALGTLLMQDGIKPISPLQSYPGHASTRTPTLTDNLTHSPFRKPSSGKLTEFAVIEQGPQCLSHFLVNPFTHPLSQHVAEKVPPRTLIITCADDTRWSGQPWHHEAHMCKKMNESKRNSKESSGFHGSLAG